MVPVDSPTRIIWMAAAGKHPVSRRWVRRDRRPRGCAPPPSWSFSSNTVFFADTTRRASPRGSGLRPSTSRASTRQMRSITERANDVADDGQPEEDLVADRDFRSTCAWAQKPTTASGDEAEHVDVPEVFREVADASSIRVESGSSAPRPSKKSTNFGSTNTMRIVMVTIDINSTTDGYISADLSLLLALELALDVARELLECDVEAAGQLGGCARIPR